MSTLWAGVKLLSDQVLCGINGLDEAFFDEVAERVGIIGETALHNLFLKLVQTRIVDHDKLEHLQFDLVNAGEHLLLLIDFIYCFSFAQNMEQLSAKLIQLRCCLIVVLLDLLSQLYAEICQLVCIDSLL